MLKYTVVGKNPAPPVVYVKHGIFSISAGAGWFITPSSTADWPLWADSLHPYLVAFPKSPMWTKKSPENPSISRVLPSKDVQYHLMPQTGHPQNHTKRFSKPWVCKKLTLAVCELNMIYYIYMYIIIHKNPDAPCMDYLPTISEKCPHSRGNGLVTIPIPRSIWDNIYIYAMDRTDWLINKLKGADRAEYKSPTNTN